MTAALTAGGLAPAVAAPDARTADRAAAPAWQVKARTGSAPVVVDEDKVVVRGKVSRAAAGEKVVLQQRLEGQRRWKRSGTFTVKKDGSFKAIDDPSTGGLREYRVLKPAGDGRSKGVSKELSVTVLAWLPLGDFISSPAEGASVRFATIGTDIYDASLVQTTPGTPGFAEFTLGRVCTQMRGAFSLLDDSQTGSTGRVVLTADGTVIADQALALGTFVPVTGQIEGLFRLRVDLSSSGDPTSVPRAPQGYAAFASPEVLCAT